MQLKDLMLLLKGSVENFVYSINDYIKRESFIIRQYPPGSLIWGLGRFDRRIKNNMDVLLYITKNNYNEGGVVLYGTVVEVKESQIKYWPIGAWKHIIVISVKALAPNILSNPHDPSKWQIVRRSTIEQMGLRILPGVQTVPEEIALKIIEKLNPLVT